MRPLDAVESFTVRQVNGEHPPRLEVSKVGLLQLCESAHWTFVSIQGRSVDEFYIPMFKRIALADFAGSVE